MHQYEWDESLETIQNQLPMFFSTHILPQRIVLKVSWGQFVVTLHHFTSQVRNIAKKHLFPISITAHVLLHPHFKLI